MHLLIVESPTKARKIQNILGKNTFKVIACCGHIRDLDKKTLSIDIENGFTPNFVNIPGKLQEIKKEAKAADQVWLGSDNDVEGEAIAWHLAKVLGVMKTHKRITFNEITDQAIKHAIENPKKIDQNLVEAQIARRVIDRLVGFKLSPILWKNIDEKNISAGRVQSAALKLICDREAKVNLSTDQTCHWVITSNFRLRGTSVFQGKLQDVKLNTSAEAEALLQTMSLEPVGVDTTSNKTSTKPPKPFNTCSLQQEAGEKLSMSSKVVMKVAQSLYEQGFITYMRTDSHTMSEEAHADIRAFVCETYGEDQYAQRALDGKKGAHEAIRPTNVTIKTLPVEVDEQSELYNMIWKRTVASQMAEAVFNELTINIRMEHDRVFVGKIRTLVVEGWLRLYGHVAEEIKHNNVCSSDVSFCDTVVATNVWKDPPSRYSEPLFIKTLESKGIGRPSTYAAIMDKLYSKHYIDKKNMQGVSVVAKDIILDVITRKTTSKTRNHSIGSEKSRIVPSRTGACINAFLAKNFEYIVDTGFTSELECKLDDISSGAVTRLSVLEDFWEKLSKHMEPWNAWDIKIYNYGPVLRVETKIIGLAPLFVELGIDVDDLKKEHVDVLKMFPIKRKNNVSICLGPYGVYLKKSKKNIKIPRSIYSQYGIMNIRNISDIEISNAVCLHFL
jgi:DNA topoisomerase-1